MRFQDFIESGKVRKGGPDIQLAKSMIKISDNRREAIRAIPITQNSASTIMANFYDCLREIVEAIGAREGYKVYSHEAYTYFLREKGESLIAEKFDRFRKIRNRINYYGKPIDMASTTAHTAEIEKIIEELKQKYLKDLI